MFENNIGITIISEPYKVGTSLDWFSNTNANIAVYWNPNYTGSSGVKKYEGMYIFAVQWQGIYIVACYFPPNLDNDKYEVFLEELESAIEETDLLAIVICGDFNSKSRAWGAKSTDIRGERFECWMSSKDFCLINEGTSPTCVRPQGSSIVDLTWSTVPALRDIDNWKVLEEETYSDHKYIYYTLHERKITEKSKATRRWKSSKMDIDKFQESIEWSCADNTIDLQDDPAAAALWLQKSLQEHATILCLKLKQQIERTPIGGTL